MRILVVCAAAAITIAMGVAWALWPEPLQSRDPAGYRACAMLADFQTGTIAEDKAIVVAALGDQGSKSSTPSIRAAGGENLMADPAMGVLKQYGALPDMRFADLKKMHKACEDESVDMPPWVPAA